MVVAASYTFDRAEYKWVNLRATPSPVTVTDVTTTEETIVSSYLPDQCLIGGRSA